MTEPIARDTVANALANDQAKGGVVHTFNPNASSAEKAASAGKAASQLQSIAGVNNTNGSAAPQGMPSHYCFLFFLSIISLWTCVC